MGIGVAERAHNERSAGEILVACVRADGHDGSEPGSEGRSQAIGAVFDHQRIVGLNAELGEREEIDVGRGLLGGHYVAREHAKGGGPR